MIQLHSYRVKHPNDVRRCQFLILIETKKTNNFRTAKTKQHDIEKAQTCDFANYVTHRIIYLKASDVVALVRRLQNSTIAYNDYFAMRLEYKDYC